MGVPEATNQRGFLGGRGRGRVEAGFRDGSFREKLEHLHEDMCSGGYVDGLGSLGR